MQVISVNVGLPREVIWKRPLAIAWIARWERESPPGVSALFQGRGQPVPAKIGGPIRVPSQFQEPLGNDMLFGLSAG